MQARHDRASHQKLTLSIERKDGLDSDIDSLEAIFFKHNLNHLFTVCAGVHRSFGEQDFGVSRIDLELFIECIIPQVAHIFPVSYNSVLHRV